MQLLPEKIKILSSRFHQEVVSYRRHFHANPELSFQEFKTSEYIASILDGLKIPYQKGIAGTGIVALLKGKKPDKKIVALRADMDALPIHELNEVSYKSTVPGVMHACGHDVHSASLLGVAKILNELKEEFEGTIKLIFQPGEEKLPGGASMMIKEGVLKNPEPLCVFGQHVHPSMDAGKVGFRSGMFMASTDEIYLTVKGKGGHAAMPDNYNNPLIIASKILLALNEYFMESNKRKIPETPTVLAFGKITGNGATNVIPEEVNIEGTFRTMNEEWRKEAKQIIHEICTSVASKMNACCEVHIEHGYPFLVNDETITQRARKAAEEYLGKDKVEELPIRMTAEDFAYFSQVLPVCFYRIGTDNKERGITSGVHTPTFDIDENALETSIGLMSWIAVNELNS
jgi:amidohydrolase